MQQEQHATAFEAKSVVAEDTEQRGEPRMHEKGGIILIPKPSDDAKDPLVCCTIHDGLS